MWKQLSALLRGRSFEAGERVVDQNALVILRQQIRDAAEGVAAARRAIGVATAQEQREENTHARLVARIDDLEARAVDALGQNKTELAREAAGTIARLEAERDACAASRASFTAEIERLKRVVAGAETRLRALQRGQRVAAAAEHAQRLREGTPNSSLSTLRDAEATLARLQERQAYADVAADALDEAESASNPAALSRRLAEAGCGAPLRTSADAVLERLAKRASQTA